jgi:hypothetical protein
MILEGHFSEEGVAADSIATRRQNKLAAHDKLTDKFLERHSLQKKYAQK